MGLESRAGRPGSLLRELVVGERLDLPRGMNRLLEDAFGPIAAAAGGRWSPPLDICETEESLVLVAELPGVKQGDVQVTVLDGTLTLRGERKVTPAGEGEAILRRERVAGPFVRHVLLPASVDPAKVTATCQDGVLTIRVPKKTAAKPRAIVIDVS